MRDLMTIICLSFALAGTALAAPKPHPHRAMAQQSSAPRAGCLDQAHVFAQHTAYTTGAADMMAPRCGRLLSTDTLVSARHWDQT
jgi:hypothetical protein